MGKRYRPGYLSDKVKKKRVGTAVFAVFLVLLAIVVGAVIGRYQRQLSSDNSVKAKEFYFTSDFLDGETHTLAPGSTQVEFTLGNHADELRFSEVDIDYTVTVTPADDVTVEYGNTGKRLDENAKQDNTVTIKGLKPGTYTVTAKGTGGYEKTLTTTIIVPEEKGQLYFHEEQNADYTLLTVWNEGNAAGEVTVSYTGIPDNTNPNMTDWETGGATSKEQTVEIPSHTSKVFRFFGDSEDRVITVTGADVQEKEPK